MEHGGEVLGARQIQVLAGFKRDRPLSQKSPSQRLNHRLKPDDFASGAEKPRNLLYTYEGGLQRLGCHSP